MPKQVQVLTEPLYKQCAEIKLVKPFDKNLAKKKAALKAAKDGFEKLLTYEVGEVTSASTYYIAELYYNFNRALVESERPTDLSPLEKEQYELAIDDQAFPFEEKAIQIHEKNLEYMTLGIFSTWIESSLEKLAKLVPARYAKFEESSGYIEKIDTADYSGLTSPLPIIVAPAPTSAVVNTTAPAEPPAQLPAVVQPTEPTPLATAPEEDLKKAAQTKRPVKAKKNKKVKKP
jgi:hypothetical protein